MSLPPSAVKCPLRFIVLWSNVPWSNDTVVIGDPLNSNVGSNKARMVSSKHPTLVSYFDLPNKRACSFSIYEIKHPACNFLFKKKIHPSLNFSCNK